MFGHLFELSKNLTGFPLYRCSLCHALAHFYGQTARLLTNDDVALCAAIIHGLSEDAQGLKQARCPLGKKTAVLEPASGPMRFLAAVTVTLVSEKVVDDRLDGGGRLPGWGQRWLERKSLQAGEDLTRLGFDAHMISKAFEEQRVLEKAGEGAMSELAARTGRVMENILSFACDCAGSGHHRESIGALGQRLGQMIYVRDGLTDYRDDLSRNRFNPLAAMARSCQGVQATSSENHPEKEGLRFLEEQRNEAMAILRDGPLCAAVKRDLTIGLSRVADVSVQQEDDRSSLFHRLFTHWFRWAPFLWLTSPRAVLAANGSSGGSHACYETATFLIIMIIIYMAICRGWCGNRCRGQDRVTVDHGMCGGTKTYRRDPCSGRYRDNSCC